MSSEQIGISMALAEISKAAIGPYKEYQAALHERHDVTGVSFEALRANSLEAEAFCEFVAKTVNLLPPVETTVLEKIRPEGTKLRGDRAFVLGRQASSFTTTDSVLAEALWSSTCWYETVPHYIIGQSDYHYMTALPRVTLASDDRFNNWAARVFKSDTIAARAEKFAIQKLNQRSYSAMLEQATPTIYYEDSRYGSASRNTSPGLAMQLHKAGVVSKDANRQIETHFLSLASTDASEASLTAQADRLKRLFDADQMLFVLDEEHLSTDRAVVSNEASMDEPERKRIDARIMSEFRIAERLTVLAIRFGQLEAYAGQLSALYSKVAEIRGEKITLGDSEFDGDTNRHDMANQIIDLIRSAQAAEEEKATAGRTMGRRFGFKRQKS